MDVRFPVTVKPDYVLVPVVTTKFTGHGAIYKRRAKNAANGASARSPIDFVSVAGPVRMLQDLIKGLKLSLFDFRANYETVRAGEGNSANRPG
jgi:hypothetical protein